MFEAWRAETISIGGRCVVVERARASGGIEGARRERRIVAHIELGGGELAILSGRTGDDGGYEELLTIAATVGPPHLATEAEVVAEAEVYVRANAGKIDVLPRACGVMPKVRDGFRWGWHVVFCCDPRKPKSGQSAIRVVQTDVLGHGAFIPEPTPGNTSMATPGIKRLPGMDDFERLREDAASRRR